MKTIMRKIKDENGNTVIESTFVVTITMMVICVLIFFGFIFYQQTVIQTIANDTATKIASTYAYDCKDMDLGYISEGDKTKKIKGTTTPDYYYSLFNGSYKTEDGDNFNGDKNKNAIKKGQWYAASKMNRFRLLQKDSSKGSSATKVEVEIKSSKKALLRRECVVTITESYAPPIVRLLVKDNHITFSAKGCAVITDYSDYFATMTFLNHAQDVLAKESGIADLGSNSVGLAKSIENIVDGLKGYIKTIKDSM